LTVGGARDVSSDLILRGGRVIDPSQKLDAVTDVAFARGKVAH
jgi:dihydroorotase